MDPRHAIGDFQMPASVTSALRQEALQTIAETPAKFRVAVKGLSESQLDTPYRDGGWTVGEVVDHRPDGHMKSYEGFKLELTEEPPPIKPYARGQRAELADLRAQPLEPSAGILRAVL